MSANGITGKVRRRFRSTTDSNHSNPIAPNKLEGYTATHPRQAWVADITYIRTAEGWLYLGSIMDLCSRRIVGWSLQDHMREKLISDALRMAVSRHRPPRGVIHHSDRGSQYTSDAYQKLLRSHGFIVSMSGKGNCYDNATKESFFHTLKTEAVRGEAFKTREQARGAIFDYIEVFYNRRRMHSSLDYVSPEEFEQKFEADTDAA